MDRCALFVDAGYLLADGAMAVHGTRHREQVSWDYSGLLQLLGNLARERAGMPLLRCYWYESTPEGRRGAEHESLADLPGLKLRLGKSRPGRRDGVDTELHRDLMTLARNTAIADAVVVSGDEDLATVIADAQDLGLRVTVVHVAVDGNWTISRVLRQECDDLIEISSGHLRPYVSLLSGMGSSMSSSLSGERSLDNGHSPLSNGHGSSSSNGTLATLQGSMHSPLSHTSPPAASPLTPPPSVPAPQSQLSAPVNSSSVLSGIPYGSSSQPSYLNPPISSSSSSQSTYSSLPTYSPPPSTPTPPPPPPAQPQHGPYTGPQSLPIPQQQAPAPGPSLSDAVKAAHTEGQDFGESVARDAPALWLEAVLARKPRMPSDLEARLLQGSALPIDFLLHDEVRHALRRGFWDALERSRR